MCGGGSSRETVSCRGNIFLLPDCKSNFPAEEKSGFVSWDYCITTEMGITSESCRFSSNVFVTCKTYSCVSDLCANTYLSPLSPSFVRSTHIIMILCLDRFLLNLVFIHHSYENLYELEAKPHMMGTVELKRRSPSEEGGLLLKWVYIWRGIQACNLFGIQINAVSFQTTPGKHFTTHLGGAVPTLEKPSET